ncbi:ROK family protein [Alkaliphilus peptidifermentans]|uniref:Glucokinase n=1 Tax=Alkaliphilus peptidifermentans DSM 18978 TaxID=1120976 RepID=A0A1G5KTK9_9FIRM|nr:ROK family protein [Alkaliphilus peptidifermentans]SCZ03269.1 glucokinase [Alkaliphilus peptidifermentans DSM 18978]
MENKYWIGIDFGGTNIRVGLFKEDKLIHENKFLTEADRGPDYIIENIKKNIQIIKGVHDIEGIGIGMPGPIDPNKGVVLSPVNLPGWDSIPLTDILTKYFEVPCYIENDCNVAALAESLEGAGKGLNIVFYITVSTGVGGGLCINGEIVSGASGSAGEIANIIVSDKPVKHSFLNPGSLEGMASGTSIIKLAKKEGLNVNHAHEVFRLADENNKAAKEIIDSVMDHLARGMAAIAHVIDPNIFILGGGVSNSVANFAPNMKERFEQYIYPTMRGKIQVKASQLSEPGMLGAMYLVKQKVKNINSKEVL